MRNCQNFNALHLLFPPPPLNGRSGEGEGQTSSQPARTPFYAHECGMNMREWGGMFPSFIRRVPACSGCRDKSPPLNTICMERGPLSAETPETEGTMKPECLLIQSLLERQREREQCMRGKEKLRRFASGDERKKGRKSAGDCGTRGEQSLFVQ